MNGIYITDEEKANRAAYLKGKIDRLRDQWERLDSSGLYDVKASYCQRKATKFAQEVFELTGETY